jgi:two-component system sensor histidine kinase PilS (NtrC family)
VRNPLAAVRGAIEVIGARVAPSDARIVKEILTRIDGLTELMKDILLFARPPQPRIAVVDVGAMLARVVGLLRHDPAASEMTIDTTGSSAPIAADPDLLSAVILNVLLNAVQATGGRGRIAIAMGAREGFGEIRITDDGPGIPDAIRPKLFRPFFSTKPGGSGLGLATARRILEEHGGTIAIECPEGGGTRVIVHVPAAAGV